MANTERRFYLVTICILICALVVTTSLVGRTTSGTVATHLEIQDTSGHTRIILGTDSDGTAALRFINATGKKTSQILQYRDGSTSMQFAGVAEKPSVVIDAMQQGPSPIIQLTGNSYDQRLFLGAADHLDDVPSPSREAYAWGLYIPAGGFKKPYAAMGAYRDLKSGNIRGFVFQGK